jgi:hypothetical protein
MNGLVGARKAAAAVVAGVVFAFMASSLGGCGLLKPKAKKPFGEACTVDTDCDTLQCSPYGSICSKDCVYDKDCGGDLVCRSKDTGVGDFCSKSVGQPPNGVCMSASDCANGHCLKRVGQEDGPGICSKNCQNGDDCPAGMKICESISDSGMLKMCLPGDPAGAPADRPKFNPAPKKTTTTSAPIVPKVIVPTATAVTTGNPLPTATATAAPTATAKPSGTPVSPLPRKPPPPPPKKGH